MGCWISSKYHSEEKSSSGNHDMVLKDIGRRNLDIDDENNSLYEIINLFYRIYKFLQIDNEHTGSIDDVFQNPVYKNILHIDEK